MANAYNPMELMICCAARLLENGSTVAVGTGAPCAAAMLAQRTSATALNTELAQSLDVLRPTVASYRRRRERLYLTTRVARLDRWRLGAAARYLDRVWAVPVAALWDGSAVHGIHCRVVTHEVLEGAARTHVDEQGHGAHPVRGRQDR